MVKGNKILKSHSYPSSFLLISYRFIVLDSLSAKFFSSLSSDKKGRKSTVVGNIKGSWFVRGRMVYLEANFLGLVNLMGDLVVLNQTF